MAVFVQIVMFCFVTSCSLVDGCDVSVEYFNPEDGSSVFSGNSAISVYKTFTHAVKHLHGLSTHTRGKREGVLHNRHDATVASRKEIGLWLLSQSAAPVPRKCNGEVDSSFLSLAAVFTFNPSYEPPLHVTALERDLEITVSLKM